MKIEAPQGASVIYIYLVFLQLADRTIGGILSSVNNTIKTISSIPSYAKNKKLYQR